MRAKALGLGLSCAWLLLGPRGLGGDDEVYVGAWPCPSPPPGAAACWQIMLEAPPLSVYSLQLRLAYDPPESSGVLVQAGTLAQGMMLAVNATTPGLIKIGLAGGSPMAGSGELLLITFAEPANVAVEVNSVSANEGALPAGVLPTVTLVAPAAGATLTLPVTFFWSASVNPTELRLAFAASAAPGTVAVGGLPSGTSYTLTLAEWHVHKAALGPAPTYYWTVGKLGSFHAAAAWRPFTPNEAPPTAVEVLAFAAQPLPGHRVLLSWRTGVEFDLLGFRIERRASGQPWARLNSHLIPVAGGSHPNVYQMEDASSPPTLPLEYRLLAVDLHGRERVLAEARLAPGLQLGVGQAGDAIELRLVGEAGATAFLETTTSIAGGPWLPSHSVKLDAQGTGTLRLNASAGEPARFYRAR